ncbi:hypothetical protein pb186bvf_020479 [Paramecium bursaria]
MYQPTMNDPASGNIDYSKLNISDQLSRQQSAEPIQSEPNYNYPFLQQLGQQYQPLFTAILTTLLTLSTTHLATLLTTMASNTLIITSFTTTANLYQKIISRPQYTLTKTLININHKY